MIKKIKSVLKAHKEAEKYKFLFNELQKAYRSQMGGYDELLKAYRLQIETTATIESKFEIEKTAKNEAYFFILKNGYFEQFNEFCKNTEKADYLEAIRNEFLAMTETE